MEFLQELLILLKESTNDNDENIKVKREMLVKFLVSCSVQENNRVQSVKLYNKWYEDLEEKFKDVDNTDELINNWPINDDTINKIISLSEKIIMQNNTISFSKARSVNSVFDKEVIVFTNELSSGVPDIDKWISLLVGNTLKTEIVQNYHDCVFFNKTLKISSLIDMIKNWNRHTQTGAPHWAKNLLQGLDTSTDLNTEPYDLDYLILNGLNFSYSTLEHFHFRHSNLHDVKFNYCHLEHVDFSFSNLYDSKFNKIKKIESVNFSLANIGGFLIFPAYIINGFSNKLKDKLSIQQVIGSGLVESHIINLSRGLFEYGLDKGIFDKETLLTLFDFVEAADFIKYKKFISSL